MRTGRVEVITSVQRRRRWPRAEKERIVAASLEPVRLRRKWHGRRGSIQASCTAGGVICVADLDAPRPLRL